MPYPGISMQLIEGRLLDAITNKAIPFASLYYDQTFSGTETDQYGNFKLEISKDSTIPLVASAIGYYSVTISDLVFIMNGRSLIINIFAVAMHL